MPGAKANLTDPKNEINWLKDYVLRAFEPTPYELPHPNPLRQFEVSEDISASFSEHKSNRTLQHSSSQCSLSSEEWSVDTDMDTMTTTARTPSCALLSQDCLTLPTHTFEDGRMLIGDLSILQFYRFYRFMKHQFAKFELQHKYVQSKQMHAARVGSSLICFGVFAQVVGVPITSPRTSLSLGLVSLGGSKRWLVRLWTTSLTSAASAWTGKSLKSCLVPMRSVTNA